METQHLKTNIKNWIYFFIFGLVISGLTAFPIEKQLEFAHLHPKIVPDFAFAWIEKVYQAVKTTNAQFPFISYGTDWLAFAHLVIAVAFIGPLRDPVKNIWVIEFGMIACLMVIPLALICGAIRQIPFWWRIIDCSFGIFGIIPLWIVRGKILLLEKLST